MGQDQMIPFASTRNDKSVMQPFAILIWTLSTHTHTLWANVHQASSSPTVCLNYLHAVNVGNKQTSWYIQSICPKLIACKLSQTALDSDEQCGIQTNNHCSMWTKLSTFMTRVHLTLNELKFQFPTGLITVISEAMFPANHLGWHWRN